MDTGIIIHIESTSFEKSLKIRVENRRKYILSDYGQ